LPERWLNSAPRFTPKPECSTSNRLPIRCCGAWTWLPWPLIPKRQWPAVRFKDKRAITLEEHQQIIAAEVNPESKAIYQLFWHLGASQGDIANMNGEDVDWQNGTVSFVRKKTREPKFVPQECERPGKARPPWPGSVTTPERVIPELRPGIFQAN
jgi:integrase